MVILALSSTASGMAEAAVLVLAVQIAVAISQSSDTIELSLPWIEGGLHLRVVVISALVLALLVAASHVVNNLLAARLSARLLASVRARALSAYGRASWETQERENEGALQESVSSLATSGSSLMLSVSHAFAAMLTLAALLIGAFVIDARATVVVVAFGTTLFLLLRPLTRLTRKRSGGFVKTNSAFTEGVSQMSSLAFELRSFGVDGSRVADLIERSDETARLQVRANFTNRLGQHLYRDVALVLFVGALGTLEAVDTVDLASIGAVLLLMLRSLGSAQDVNGAIHAINHQLPNLETLDARISNLEADQHPTGHLPISDFERIELRAIVYRYHLDAAPALDSVDLTIASGEMLGVVGPSGGGKSTLVQLLLRLRFPTEGDILVDGRSLTDIDASSWQRIVSVVPQGPRLLAGTVRENIAFFRGVDDETVVRAARMANIASDIEALPDGYDTMLGPRGAGLSGGQSQRITIARALAGNPRLLILDEPTSALDVHSETALQRTIEELTGQVTMVIIAHRLSTIAACDRLLILDRGKVASVGSQDEVRNHPFLLDRMG